MDIGVKCIHRQPKFGDEYFDPYSIRRHDWKSTVNGRPFEPSEYTMNEILRVLAEYDNPVYPSSTKVIGIRRRKASENYIELPPPTRKTRRNREEATTSRNTVPNESSNDEDMDEPNEAIVVDRIEEECQGEESVADFEPGQIVNAITRNEPFLAGIMVPEPIDSDFTGAVWVHFPQLKKRSGLYAYTPDNVMAFKSQKCGLIRKPKCKHLQDKWYKKAVVYEEKLRELIGHL